MIIVILVICALIVAAGAWASEKEFYALSGASIVFGVVGLITSFVVLVCLVACLSNATIADEKITMYTEENKNIESQISEAIKEYQKYESGVFEKVTPENAVTLVTVYQARQAALQALKADLYEDAMALDVRQISAGNTTATQIIAAYEPLNNKADDFEVQVSTCILGLLAVAGVVDIPSYSRSKIVNQMEETQMVMLAAAHLDEETLLNKIPWLTPDDVQAIMERRDTEDFNRFHGGAADGVEI